MSTGPRKVAVIGAGIVGVTSALQLQRCGHEVLLFDRGLPGRETSYGNAGVLSDASVIVVNNPELPFRLPKMLTNANISLNYNFGFALSRLSWIVKFLFFSTKRHMHHAGRALRELQVLSLNLHRKLMIESGSDHLLSERGWLKLYRSESAYQSSLPELAFLKEMGVAYTIYSAEQLRELEPALKPVFSKGVLMTETCSVSSPLELTQAYFRLFEESGGKFVQSGVQGLKKLANDEWEVALEANGSCRVDDVVIAAGPWSEEVAGWLGYKIPMAWERGYHKHFKPTKKGQLSRPIYDVEGGFVMAPNKEGIRVLTGVELTYRDAPPNYKQIHSAADNARDVIDLGEELPEEPWLGRRPTLADSLPMIGPATRHDGLWFNFGHQHIGLSTCTGCALILADLMGNKKASIDASPFQPDRFQI